MRRVLVLGANGRLGSAVLKALTHREVSLFAFVRRPLEITLPGVHEIRGDATSAHDLSAALDVGVDAVVDAIGAGTLGKSDLESRVARLLREAMEKRGPPRLMATSAGMVKRTFFLMDHVLKPTVFRHVLAEHRRKEEILCPSSLDWTIARPPRISCGPAKGYCCSVEKRPNGSWSIAAADVAAFIADELFSPRFRRKAVFLGSGYGSLVDVNRPIARR